MKQVFKELDIAHTLERTKAIDILTNKEYRERVLQHKPIRQPTNIKLKRTELDLSWDKAIDGRHIAIHFINTLNFYNHLQNKDRHPHINQPQLLKHSNQKEILTNYQTNNVSDRNILTDELLTYAAGHITIENGTNQYTFYNATNTDEVRIRQKQKDREPYNIFIKTTFNEAPPLPKQGIHPDNVT